MRPSTVVAFTLFSSTHAVTVSRNGQCGSDVGKTCSGSQFGSCCSQYGWCGSSSSYCQSGCQSGYGTCQGTSAPAPVSTKGRCGASYGGQTCLGSQYGNCCSRYFYCGSSDAYCASQSCQAGYGTCNAASSSSQSSTRSSTSSRTSSTTSRTSTHTTTSSSASHTSSSSTASSTSSTKTSSSSSSSSSSLATSTSSSSSVSSSQSSSSSSQLVSSSSSSIPTPTPTPTSTSTPSPTPTIAYQPVVNGGFEQGLAPWMETNVDQGDNQNSGVVSSNAHSGTHSFQMAGADYGWGYAIGQTVTLLPNTAYLLQVWSKQDDASNCQIEISMFEPYSICYPTQTYSACTLLIPADQVGTSTSAEFTIEADCQTPGAGEYIYFDDITLTAQS